MRASVTADESTCLVPENQAERKTEMVRYYKWEVIVQQLVYHNGRFSHLLERHAWVEAENMANARSFAALKPGREVQATEALVIKTGDEYIYGMPRNLGRI